MIKCTPRTSLTLAGLLAPLLVGVALGQAPTPVAKTEANAYRAKQVLGSKVHIQGDFSIGSVDDLVFNDSGNVEYLIVANEGKLVTVPWEAAKFNFEKQTASLNITQAQYKVIPTYTVREYPVYFEPAYRTQVYKWYGLTPRVRR
jgi:PRC-barrel domain